VEGPDAGCASERCWCGADSGGAGIQLGVDFGGNVIYGNEIWNVGQNVGPNPNRFIHGI
jgi:hypothetical protein